MAGVYIKNPSRNEFIGIVAALMALNSLAIDIMLPALPYMSEAFGIHGVNNQQYVIGAYMFGYGFGEIIFGPVSDKFGRRSPLLAGVIIYILASAMAVMSPSFETVLTLRLVQGIGAASTRVVATSVVRDRFSGHSMAEVMSLVIMLFMAIPVLAPGVGQLLLLAGPWESIFIAMSLAGIFTGIWVYFRLPESLPLKNRRPLTIASVFEGFRVVVKNRMAFAYGLAGMFMFASLFGFLNSAQQIYVGIFHLGPFFPVAFAAVAGLMGISSFYNSKMVRLIGMRRLSHGAVLALILSSGILLLFSIHGAVTFRVFFPLLAIIMSCFSWAVSNMNSLSMEPLGEVAGTASSAFGFIQTVGGVVIGGYIGQLFNQTIIPVVAGYLLMGIMALLCILFAENGKLFTDDILAVTE